MGIAFRAHFVYMIVSNFVIWGNGRRSVVGGLVSRLDHCVYDAVNEDGILDALFINGDSVWLYADSTRPCAERKELVICAGG